jgi:hypothetical protein
MRPRDVCLDVGFAMDARTEADFYIMSAHTLSTFSQPDVEELEGGNSSQPDLDLENPAANRQLGPARVLR